MKLEDKHVKEIKAWADRTGGLTCAGCTKQPGSFSLGGHLAKLETSSSGTNRSFYPVFILFCKNCGFANMYHPKFAGIDVSDLKPGGTENG